MEEILLSIGSVVTLKGIPGKVIITGYLNFGNNNGLFIRDYEGYSYPFGTTLNTNYSFNANEIETVVFEGYKDENFEKVFGFVADFKNKIGNGPIKSAEKPRYAFDENGVVVADYEADNYEVMENGNNANPFLPSNEKKSRTDVPEDPANWSIFNHIEFDENGVVVAAVENSQVPDADKASAPTVIVRRNENEVQNANGRYEFDTNGVVVADNSVNTNASSNGRYEFDENGVVIADNSVNTNASSNGRYEFDENGVVIADNSVNTNASSNSPYTFDENGVVIADNSTNSDELKPVSPFKFDESGVVTEDNSI